uniref:Uncharacterized protein n=1 Tax=Hyaloperonospora arabidopsidis (strain Emoy2) TaxID=559515 RepID=M4BJJ8_HYAAE
MEDNQRSRGGKYSQPVHAEFPEECLGFQGAAKTVPDYSSASGRRTDATASKWDKHSRVQAKHKRGNTVVSSRRVAGKPSRSPKPTQCGQDHQFRSCSPPFSYIFRPGYCTRVRVCYCTMQGHGIPCQQYASVAPGFSLGTPAGERWNSDGHSTGIYCGATQCHLIQGYRSSNGLLASTNRG